MLRVQQSLRAEQKTRFLQNLKDSIDLEGLFDLKGFVLFLRLIFVDQIPDSLISENMRMVS
jgi:hypothetical protein